MMKLLIITILLSFSVIASEKANRKVSFIISKDGIFPDSISAYVGDELEVYVTSTDAKSCLMINGHKLFLSSHKGTVSEGKVTLRESGRFKVYCPSDKYEGYITVLSKTKRNIASSTANKPSVWVPKDYSE